MIGKEIENNTPDNTRLMYDGITAPQIEMPAETLRAFENKVRCEDGILYLPSRVPFNDQFSNIQYDAFTFEGEGASMKRKALKVHTNPPTYFVDVQGIQAPILLGVSFSNQNPNLHESIKPTAFTFNPKTETLTKGFSMP